VLRQPGHLGGVILQHHLVESQRLAQQRPARIALFAHLDREERRIVDPDADLLDRRHQKVSALLALEDGREQPHQRRPADWRSHVEPRTIAGDSHVEIAAERRVPQMHRR